MGIVSVALFRRNVIFIHFVLRDLMALGLVSMSAPPTLAAHGLDTSDTASILSGTALVLFMTLPDLALFYASLGK